MANNILSVTDGDYGYPSNKLAPLVQGQYGQSLPIEIHDLAGNVVNLTGYSVLSATKRAANGNVTAIVGTIALSGTPAVAPQLTWTIAEEDTGVAGKFDLVLSLSNGSVVYETHPVELKIASNPAANAVAAPGLLSVTAEQRAWLAAAVEAGESATGGNLVQWNNDGTIADSGRAKTEIGNATAIRARPVADVVPTDGQVLTYDETNGWQPETPSAGGAVDSVFGRTGAVVAATGDYSAQQVGAANVYNVKSAAYGAAGDGVTDDTAAILAAIAAAKAAGGGTVFLPKGTYLISKSLVMPSSVELRGSGVQSKITKAATVKSLLTANASAGATSVTVADSTGFLVGKAIHIYDTSSVEWLSTQAVVTNIAGNVITFDDALDGTVQTTRSATATTSFPLIRNEAGATDIVIRDLTLDQNANASDPANDFTLAIIHWVGAYRALVENCTLINACGDAYSDQAQDGTGITPAANLIVTCKNTIRGCKIRSAGRHAVHLGTCIRGGYILDNDIADCTAGFGFFYCAYVTETIAANNRMENCFSGFAGIDERDYDNIIVGNVTKNMTSGYAVEINSSTATGGRIAVIGNQFLCDATASGDAKTGRVYINLPDCVFQGNIINMAAKAGDGLRIGTSGARAIVSGNKIIGSSGGGGTTGVQVDAVSDVRFIGNSIYNFSKCVSVRGAARLIAEGNQLSPTSTCWNFETSTSTDCIIRGERTTFATPVTEVVPATRLIYEGIGTNGSDDPATGGAWNGISGRRFDGTMVRWNSGTGEKFSIFYNGVGWTTLN